MILAIRIRIVKVSNITFSYQDSAFQIKIISIDN